MRLVFGSTSANTPYLQLLDNVPSYVRRFCQSLCMGNSLVARIDRCEPCRLREKAPQILEDMHQCTSRSALHA